MYEIEAVKKIIIFLRAWTKLITLLVIAVAIICGVIFLMYTPMYSVTLSGEFIGYTKEKRDLQAKIYNYIKSGDGNSVAFVDIENLPDYNLCLLKKDTEANDEEIFQIVASTGTPYYKYYAILDGTEEKEYVSSYEEAEAVISGLTEKNSMNKDTVTYLLKYETDLKEFATADTIISELYKETPKVKVNKNINTQKNVDYSSTPIGLALIEPVQGTITSRFGTRSRGLHTGLDVATSSGTPIKAVADGVVEYAGYKGSYGYLVVVNHGNGIQTYYAHCSKMYVNAGDAVSQGQVICAVGSTGNSTGPHLHIEIRVNRCGKKPTKLFI